MSDVMTEPPQDRKITAEDVLAYLQKNPRFLQQNPNAVDLLVPPKGDRKVKDFQSFMIERLKQDKEKVVTTARTLVENARSNMNNQVRIQNVILRLLEASTFEEFIQIITMDMSAMLDTDISVLVVESTGDDIPHVHTSGVRLVPPGTIDKWMGGKNALLQSNISGIEVIYGGAYTLVQSQALLRVDISMNTPPAVLAFGSRDPEMFDEGQATDQVSFLARVVERSFRAWLHLT
ncbi:MAG TPA: DUF484 family protein [Micavibrio sp.]|nr:DUF484 family protein [Micavibrio sp.]